MRSPCSCQWCQPSSPAATGFKAPQVPQCLRSLSLKLPHRFISMPSYPPTQKAPSSGLFITCLEIQAIRVVRSLRRLDWIKVGLTAFFIQRAGGDSACRTTTGNGVRLVLFRVAVVPQAGHRVMALQFLHLGDLGRGRCLLLPSVDR